ESLLHGRFLHITDMHPDPLNKIHSAIELKCHRKEKDLDDSELSHKYGDAMSGCDSPMDLYKDTLTWIRENLKDHIDFVVWTGDNIRHDNDRRHPRLEMDILNSNQLVADRMSEIFMDEGDETIMPLDRRVKIIPSLGNNDVYPHNLFAPGPTLQTREMYKIWRDFVPAEQMHTFDRGVYFFREVIPGKLAVLSINTLYFFKSNPLNDNCDNRKQPGYKLFEWLAVTLKELRHRNMKVWLTGHVPPIPKNLHYSCYAKMSVWQHEYRDIIIGSLFGHMNIDHFMPLDSVKAWRSIQNGLAVAGLEDEAKQLNFETYNEDEQELADDPSTRYQSAPFGKVSYLEEIRDTFYSDIKGKTKAGQFGERYSFAHISCSVIPTFNPGFRVWEYNLTGLFDTPTPPQSQFEPWSVFFERVKLELDESDQLAELLSTYDLDDPIHKEFKTLGKDKTIPPIMDPNIPLGPAYVAQQFSPERYVQYYIDLSKAQKEAETSGSWEFHYDVQYTTDDEIYKMDSLLVNDWLSLAKTLSKAGKVKSKTNPKMMWKDYVDRAFIKTGYQD
ncbi:hypothetical protein CANARDRAFT_182087, partial [[Candida] arabinofermentans NRRL YB-2248]